MKNNKMEIHTYTIEPWKVTLPEFVPVQCGLPTAFTCLGNWYDLKNLESLDSLKAILIQVGKRDLGTGLEELVLANYKFIHYGNAK